MSIFYTIHIYVPQAAKLAAARFIEQVGRAIVFLESENSETGEVEYKAVALTDAIATNVKANFEGSFGLKAVPFDTCVEDVMQDHGEHYQRAGMIYELDGVKVVDLHQQFDFAVEQGDNYVAFRFTVRALTVESFLINDSPLVQQRFEAVLQADPRSIVILTCDEGFGPEFFGSLGGWVDVDFQVRILGRDYSTWEIKHTVDEQMDNLQKVFAECQASGVLYPRMTPSGFDNFVDLPENRVRAYQLIGSYVLDCPPLTEKAILVRDNLVRLLTDYIQGNPNGQVLIEEQRFHVAEQRYIPALAIVHHDTLLLAVEIVNGDDGYSRCRHASRIMYYQHIGCEHWLVWPERQELWQHNTRSRWPESSIPTEYIIGGENLPGLKIAVAHVFASIEE